MRDKAWWSCVKIAGGALKSSTIPLIVDASGGKHASSKGKADCLASYFANKCSLSRHDLQVEQFPPLPQPSTPACILHPFPASRGLEITRETEHLQSNWPGHHLSEGAQRMLERTDTPLAKLFALCFHTGVPPDMWKTANVVPIHKRSSKAAVCNYWSVSLLSIMSKVMEIIINKQLMNHLDRHELLTT